MSSKYRVRFVLLTSCLSASLEDVHKITTLAQDNTATVGASLAHVHVPGRQVTADEVGDNIEIGMGIHNEEGFGRVKTTLPGLVTTMLAQLLDQADTDRAFINLQPGDEFIAMVNNLGGISPLEIGAITAEVIDQLEGTYKVTPTRLLSGTYMTSLNGLGFSITLLKAVDKRFISLIDAPADAAGWSPPVKPESWARGIDTKKTPADTNSSKDTEEFAPSNLQRKLLLCNSNSPKHTHMYQWTAKSPRHSSKPPSQASSTPKPK